ncbi:cation:proton antiporter [Nocardioidaceae bacterium]|nr:cation:proton antiporter [Nocardioidaceae bacterium]
MSSDVAFLLFGACLLLAVVLPTALTRVAVSAPLVLMGLGIVLGLSPITEGITIDPFTNQQAIEHVTELTVIVALMGVGLAIERPLSLRDKGSLRRWSGTWRLLAIGMPLSIALVALSAWWLAGVPIALALLLGAALAPTDPVLASDVQIGGPVVDSESGVDPRQVDDDEVRFSLTSEAGLNDGLAFPFVYIALLAAGAVHTVDSWQAALGWGSYYVLVKVAIGVVVGLAVGRVLARFAYGSRIKALRLADRGEPLLVLAALLTAYGLTEVLQGYGFLAVFLCAMAMRSAERRAAYNRAMHQVIERVEVVLTLAVLLFFGIAVSRGLLSALTWQGALVAVLLVLVIRPLTAYLSLRIAPAPADCRHATTEGERWTIAFFGVRGVGTIYYLAYATGFLGVETVELWSIAGLAIVLSVTLHGITATPVLGKVDAHRRQHRRGHQETSV